jgi:hypothetical protein
VEVYAHHVELVERNAAGKLAAQDGHLIDVVTICCGFGRCSLA